MNPGQLGRFIERALGRLRGPASLDPEDLPTSPEEFAALCDLLGAKVEEIKQGLIPTTLPPRPTYDGPPYPGLFEPSEEFERLSERRWARAERVEDAIRYGRRGPYLERVRRELAATERELTAQEEIEKERRREHHRRTREYDEAWSEHRRRVRRWDALAARERKKLDDAAALDKGVQRIRRAVKRAFADEADPAERRASGPNRVSILDFEIAAPSERNDNRAVYRYYREVLGRRSLKGFDQDRLDKVLSLPRRNWARGKAGKDGYIVLFFDHTEKVVMECPLYKNALFVLDSGEERLLKMNKQQLNASDEVRKIIHSKHWFRRLKKELGIE